VSLAVIYNLKRSRPIAVGRRAGPQPELLSDVMPSPQNSLVGTPLLTSFVVFAEIVGNEEVNTGGPRIGGVS
jgi:hypothetical protein